MTTNQINVILMTAKLGSISAAAKKLGLSQPNASNCIKAAEEEAGFDIFQRTRDGIVATANGVAFLEQAQKIHEANETISKIRYTKAIRQFRLGSDSFSAAATAFIKLCSSYDNEKNIGFQHYKISLEQGLEHIKQRRLDCLVALTFEEDSVLIKRICKKFHIQNLFISKVPTAVCVRNGHPLLSQISSISFFNDFDILRPYNYVYYGHLNNESETAHTYKIFNIPHSGLILVNETDERLRIVSESDAFSVGVQHDSEVLEQYNLTNIPIQDIQLNIHCYFREAEKDRDEIKKYINILEKEIEKRFSDSAITKQ